MCGSGAGRVRSRPGLVRGTGSKRIIYWPHILRRGKGTAAAGVSATYVTQLGVGVITLYLYVPFLRSWGERLMRESQLVADANLVFMASPTAAVTSYRENAFLSLMNTSHECCLDDHNKVLGRVMESLQRGDSSTSVVRGCAGSALGECLMRFM